MFSNQDYIKLKSVIDDSCLQHQPIESVVDKLRWSSALQNNDSKKFVAGMILVYYQFIDAPEPAIAAAQWRLTQDITDSQGQDGHSVFELGYNLLDS